MSRAVTAVCLLLLSPGAAQEPLVRITVSLVQVDAIVTGRDGRPATDLTADDFEILEDGKPQKITRFAYISTASVAPHPPRTTQAAPEPPVPLRPDQVKRTIALVIDDLGISFESMAQVRETLKKFVRDQMRPGDLAAVIRTGGGMGAAHGFTTDRRELLAAVERLRWNPVGRAGASAFAPFRDPDEELPEEEAAAEERTENTRLEHFAVGTLGALEYVVRGLREMPGRKSVVMLSDGLRMFDPDGPRGRVLESLERLTDQANRSAVVLYTVDTRGLPALSLMAADDVRGRDPLRAVRARERRRQDYFDLQNGLHYLAAETGGIFYRDSNDLGEGIAQALADQSGYYLIGYRPAPETFNRAFHRIQVRVRRPGLTVRSRTGFLGVEDRQEAIPAPRSRQEQLARAIFSPFRSSSVRVKLTSLYTADSPDGPGVTALLHIDGRDLTFSEEPGGWRKAVIDVLLMGFGEGDAPAGQSDKTFTVRVRNETFRMALANGLVYTVRYPVKRAGPYHLRIAVRDAADGKTGSASQFLEIPDLSKGQLALSGILLGEKQRQGVTPQAMANPATRIFRRGQEMLYACQVLNPKPDAATGKSRVEVRVRIFDNDKQVFEGPPSLLQSEVRLDRRALAGGRLRLGAAMKPGDYVLQVAARDHLAGTKAAHASQWIDFHVAP